MINRIWAEVGVAFVCLTVPVRAAAVEFTDIMRAPISASVEYHGDLPTVFLTATGLDAGSAIQVFENGVSVLNVADTTGQPWALSRRIETSAVLDPRGGAQTVVIAVVQVLEGVSTPIDSVVIHCKPGFVIETQLGWSG